jgi:hypothetical protein
LKLDIFIRDENNSYVNQASVEATAIHCGRGGWNSTTPSQHGTKMIWEFDEQRSIVLSPIHTLLIDSTRYALNGISLDVAAVYLDPVQATPKPAPRPLLPLGKIVATWAVMEALDKASQTPSDFTSRHNIGDWGDLCEDDRRENARALIAGNRIMSVYKTKLGTIIWCITEADRSSTTLLLPSEY